MRKFPLHLAISALTLSAMGGFVGAAQAAAKSLVLEEVVVTAQRKAESLQDAAIAVDSVDARYRDERWVEFDFTPTQRAESVTTYDASLQLGSSDDTWSLLAYVRNFTDEEVNSITQVFGSMSNLVSTSYAPPRTYGVRFDYNF